MAGLIEKYLKEVAEEQRVLGEAEAELNNAQVMVAQMLPKVVNASIKSGKNPQMNKAERIDILRQILEERYDVNSANERIKDSTARLDKLCGQFHGEMNVNLGDFADEMENALQLPKGVMCIEILDGDEGVAEISSKNVPVKNLTIPHEQIKLNICNSWKNVSILFSLEHIYPIMSVDTVPSKMKFKDGKSLYDHMKVKFGKIIIDKDNDRFGKIPYAIEIDDMRQIVLPHKIGDFLDIPANLQGAFIRAVAKYKKTEKTQENLIDNTERE